MVFALFVGEISPLIGQNCQLPIVNNASDMSISGFKISWLDLNSSSISYDIEFGIKGFTRNFQANIQDIQSKEFVFTNLESGTTYEIYVRTNCDNNESSDWNGPYFVNTNIDNNNSCDLNLEIGDNNCNRPSAFQIEINQSDNSIIGDNIELDKVLVNIQHPWPPDLEITLISPEGRTCTLSSHNGNGSDDYGDITECMNALAFSESACTSIVNFPPPFRGVLKPEESFKIFEGESINGIWNLSICDRANGDVGFLKNIMLDFSSEICVPAPQFKLVDVEATSALVNWNNFNTCDIIGIAYKKKTDPDFNTSVDFEACQEEQFRILNLEADTDYELYTFSNCQGNIESARSCIIEFRTLCQNSSFQSNFDNLPICNIQCDTLCPIDEIWRNDASNINGWFVNNGLTSTNFTGPNADIGGSGNYIYAESQILACEATEYILISECLSYTEINNCAIAFSYHMFGNEMGTLELQLSTNNKDWQTLWLQDGNKGEQWLSDIVSLPTTFDKGQLRFKFAKDVDAIRSDVALDLIKLIGLETTGLSTFYEDMDSDGFGGQAPILFCSDNPPEGFVTNNLDCDDSDARINPSAVEINCNLIDENCNGLQDDLMQNDISYQLTGVSHESCVGKLDGAISIEVNGGLPPYQFLWSNSASTQDLTNIGTGLYTCTISDFGGCLLVTDPIFVDFEEVITYSLIQLTPPSCQGQNDGLATLLISGGQGPYEVLWDSLNSGPVVNQLSDGDYIVTITDSDNCQIETDLISVTAPQTITAGVSLKRDIECAGEETGFIQLGIFGGVPPYNVLWSEGSTGNIVTQLPEGNYTVTVTDNAGCQNVINDIQIESPDSLSISLDNIEHVNCNGGDNGLINIAVSGGTAHYTYAWSNGERTQDIFNQSAGEYSITVSDFNACTKVFDNIEILESPPLNINLAGLTAVNCQGSRTGFVEVFVNGGAPDYQYNWSAADGIEGTANALDSLSPGQYTLTVVDAFECKSDPFIFEIISNDRALEVDLFEFNEIQCFGDSTAIITAEVDNGIAPYDFNWNIGQQALKDIDLDTLYQVSSASYNLTVTDAEGCVGIADSIQINQPEEITYEVLETMDNDCWYNSNGFIELNISGGQENYSVTWTTGQMGMVINNLTNGIYTADIKDANDCQIMTVPIEISSPDALIINADIGPTTANNGFIDLNIEGGIAPYAIQWYDPLILEDNGSIDNLTPGIYNVLISDFNGCQIDTSFRVEMVNTLIESSVLKSQVFPNPFSDIVQVHSPYNIQSINIINTKGQSIKKVENIQRSSIDLKLGDQEAGIYILEIKSKGQTEVVKIIKH